MRAAIIENGRVISVQQVSGELPVNAVHSETANIGDYFSEGSFSPPELLQGDVRVARLLAYANPVTGSDRLFSEAARMQLMGESGWAEVRSQAKERFLEIQSSNPWPTEQGAP